MAQNMFSDLKYGVDSQGAFDLRKSEHDRVNPFPVTESNTSRKEGLRIDMSGGKQQQFTNEEGSPIKFQDEFNSMIDLSQIR